VREKQPKKATAMSFKSVWLYLPRYLKATYNFGIAKSKEHRAEFVEKKNSLYNHADAVICLLFHPGMIQRFLTMEELKQFINSFAPAKSK